MKQLVISTKLIGRRGPLLAPITLQLDTEATTVRSLIASIVREQVAAFRDRQASRRLVQILTESEMTDGLEIGKLVSGGQDLQQQVDVEEAIRAAHTAFEDGLFYFFLSDTQLTRLDEPVELGRSTEVLFLRLVPLVGG